MTGSGGCYAPKLNLLGDLFTLITVTRLRETEIQCERFPRHRQQVIKELKPLQIAWA